MNIVGSLLSAAFFLAFYAFLCRNGIGEKLAFLTATLATFSFWWIWISVGLLKNELGIVIAVLFFQSFIDSARNRKIGITTVALGLALLWAHASTSYWVLLSLVGFFAIRELRGKR